MKTHTGSASNCARSARKGDGPGSLAHEILRAKFARNLPEFPKFENGRTGGEDLTTSRGFVTVPLTRILMQKTLLLLAVAALALPIEVLGSSRPPPSRLRLAHVGAPALPKDGGAPPAPLGQPSGAVAGPLRLSLRGGGLPLIPIVAAAAGGVTLKLNEGIRGKVMDVLSHVSFGGDPRGGKGPQVQRRETKADKQKGGEAGRGETKVVRSDLKEGYDLRNGTWAYEIEKAEPGCLLVASPDTFRFAGQRQVLDQAVVLLVRHGPTGSSGFIINRPTAFAVGDVTKKLSHFEQNPLYLGGDIGEGVYMIHGFEGMTNATEVSEGIFYGGSEEAMSMVEDSQGTAADFRFFFKYTAWAPGQLEGEIQGGCWCPIRSSLDLVLKPRVYQGLHIAKYHKVFWHQVLKTLGGRFDNISSDTIHKEEAERANLENWVAVLGDGSNVTVENHESIEIGAMNIASVAGADLNPDALRETVIGLMEKVGAQNPEATETSVLQALSKVFFEEFSLVALESDADAANPENMLLTNTISTKQGSALALAPLYMAIARQLGAPLRFVNVSSLPRGPYDLMLRWDDRSEAPSKDSILIDLQQEGKLLSVAEGQALLPPGATEADLNPVPHVQVYSRILHKLADAHSRAGNEQQVLLWLAQLRVLQGAINTRILMSEQSAAGPAAGEVLDLKELLGDKLVRAGGAAAATSELEGKVVAVYFSAQWCAPCKAFTPKLKELYEALTAAGKPFEVVLVSLDRGQDAFDAYFGDMPWLAVPFADAEQRAKVGQALGADSIPKLVLLDADGSVITVNGREVVAGDPTGANFPWAEAAGAGATAE